MSLLKDNEDPYALKGMTDLMAAAYEGDALSAVMIFAINDSPQTTSECKQQELHALDQHGNTALHYALQDIEAFPSDKAELKAWIAQCLIERQLDPFQKNFTGVSALDLISDERAIAYDLAIFPVWRRVLRSVNREP